VAESVRGGDTPVPVNFTVWGLVDALSVIVSAPVREPVVVGVNVTSMLHDFPPARLIFVRHVLVPARLKSPLARIPEMVSAAL
jgi:hypothetical protein